MLALCPAARIPAAKQAAAAACASAKKPSWTALAPPARVAPAPLPRPGLPRRRCQSQAISLQHTNRKTTRGKDQSANKIAKGIQRIKSQEGTRREGPPFPSNQRYKISNLHSKSLNLGEGKEKRTGGGDGRDERDGCPLSKISPTNSKREKTKLPLELKLN